MSHRVPKHFHQRGITIHLGPVTATIPDGSDDSGTGAPTPTPAGNPIASTSSNSESTKSTKTPKDATTSESPASSSSVPNLANPTISSSASTTSSTTISPSTASTTLTSSATTISQTAAAASATATPSSHSSGTSPGLVAFAVIICIAFAGAVTWVVIMRRQAKQREWTFQQHQRIFERFDKSKGNGNDNDMRSNTSHTTNSSIHPPIPVAMDDGKAWQAGTGASVITAGPSVVRKLDWDQGPERRPKSIIEAKVKRKPLPPSKELKNKTFSQYLPYLLPQHHSAEVIELGKAQERVYQRPTYKPAG